MMKVGRFDIVLETVAQSNVVGTGTAEDHGTRFLGPLDEQ